MGFKRSRVQISPARYFENKAGKGFAGRGQFWGKMPVTPIGGPYARIAMKTTKHTGKPRGTRDLIENVAPNLFRHRENGSYYGMSKIAGRRVIHALETADRKTADGKLNEWLGDLKKVAPGNRDMTLAMLLKK